MLDLNTNNSPPKGRNNERKRMRSPTDCERNVKLRNMEDDNGEDEGDEDDKDEMEEDETMSLAAKEFENM